MTVQKINFTSSLLDKSRFNMLVNNPIKNEKAEEKTTQEIDNKPQENTVEENNADKSETVASSEQKNHTARNWAIGLSAAAVLTGLGVLAGRRGYMGDGVQKILKGAKKEAGELIDDVSESVSGGLNKATGRSTEKPTEEATGNIFSRTAGESEGTVLGHAQENEGTVLSRNSVELAEQEPHTVTTGIIDDIEEGATVIVPKLEDSYSAMLSKDGKFKIPMTKEEVDIEATRKYLKAPKVKILRKYRKLPELKLKEIIGDFNPENIYKSKIVDGVYIHPLKKGEKLEVHFNKSTGEVDYIARFDAKGTNTGYVRYYKNGKLDYVEHPNGTRYKYSDNGTLIHGERYAGSDCYHYDNLGLNIVDQKVSDSVERKIVMMTDGKRINYVEYYVNTSNGGYKLVKEDMYCYDSDLIDEYFDIAGNENNYLFGGSRFISKSAKLKFWRYFPRFSHKNDAIYVKYPRYDSKFGTFILNLLKNISE